MQFFKVKSLIRSEVRSKNEDMTSSEEKFRRIIENGQDGIISLDKEWQIIYINQVAEKMLNRQPGSLLNQNIWQAFPEAIESPFYKMYNDALQTQKRRSVEYFSENLGKWIRATIFPSTDGVTIYFHDISNQKAAEVRAIESDQNYRLFLDRITDGFIVLDRNFFYIYANQKIYEQVQMLPGTLPGKNVWEVFPEAVGSYTYRAFITAMNEQRFISNIDYFEPLNIWQENHIYPSPEGLSVFIKDITEQKKLERELLEREKKQQLQMTSLVLEAQEKERTYIGQELHDNVNQLVTATKLMLSLVKSHLGDVQAIATICINNLEKIITENRRLAHELVTPDLVIETLAEQVKNLVESMFGTTAIEAELITSDLNETLLNEKQKLAIYRIIQEHCTNIIKHAKASLVRIVLSTSEADFTMEIADNGQGMDAKKSHKGIGLKNIKNRLQVFNGSMRIETNPGNGFILYASMPINNE